MTLATLVLTERGWWEDLVMTVSQGYLELMASQENLEETVAQEDQDPLVLQVHWENQEVPDQRALMVDLGGQDVRDKRVNMVFQGSQASQD